MPDSLRLTVQVLGALAGQRLDPGCAARTVKLNRIADARSPKTDKDMKTTRLDYKFKAGHACGQRGRTAALLGGLVLTLILPGTGVNAQVLGISNSVLLSWPEPSQEQIVVASDSLTSTNWMPVLEPIFKRFGQMCMAVPATASLQFYKTVSGRQLADDLGETWGPFTNRHPWVAWSQGAGEEWVITNGVLQVDVQAPPQPGFALMPMGTNVDAVHHDFSGSVDILDWQKTNGTNWSSFTLVARGQILSSTYGKGYFGGLLLTPSGTVTNVALFINYNGPEVYGQSFTTGAFPLPYRLQLTVVGGQITVRVFSLTTGQLFRELGHVDYTLAQGYPALWFNGATTDGDSFTIRTDNLIISGTKP
jgi:hypothetical protein